MTWKFWQRNRYGTQVPTVAEDGDHSPVINDLLARIPRPPPAPPPLHRHHHHPPDGPARIDHHWPRNMVPNWPTLNHFTKTHGIITVLILILVLAVVFTSGCFVGGAWTTWIITKKIVEYLMWAKSRFGCIWPYDWPSSWWTESSIPLPTIPKGEAVAGAVYETGKNAAKAVTHQAEKLMTSAKEVYNTGKHSQFVGENVERVRLLVFEKYKSAIGDNLEIVNTCMAYSDMPSLYEECIKEIVLRIAGVLPTPFDQIVDADGAGEF